MFHCCIIVSPIYILIAVTKHFIDKIVKSEKRSINQDRRELDFGLGKQALFWVTNLHA